MNNVWKGCRNGRARLAVYSLPVKLTGQRLNIYHPEMSNVRLPISFLRGWITWASKHTPLICKGPHHALMVSLCQSASAYVHYPEMLRRGVTVVRVSMKSTVTNPLNEPLHHLTSSFTVSFVPPAGLDLHCSVTHHEMDEPQAFSHFVLFPSLPPPPLKCSAA